MLKDDLIRAIAKESGETAATVNRVLDSLNKTLTTNLQTPGSKIKVHGLATFECKVQAARTARNPKTGESIQVPAKQVVKAKSHI
ncbi:MAG: HU family DNA-binding protein [Aeromonas popoffii]|uniref:HU family DNA-binding protein n=1 Tax=Aeromonas popoffii TaxID=70856 RepID=UPI003F3CE6D4